MTINNSFKGMFPLSFEKYAFGRFKASLDYEKSNYPILLYRQTDKRKINGVSLSIEEAKKLYNELGKIIEAAEQINSQLKKQ